MTLTGPPWPGARVLTVNLRQRALLSVGLTLVGLTAVVYLCSHNLLLSSFRRLENAETGRNVDRAANALAQEVNKLDSLTSDWSDWDDTYKFIQDRNQAYRTVNLETVFIDVDLIMFLDTKGKIVETHNTMRSRKLPAPDAQEVWKALHFDGDPARWPTKSDGVSGIVKLASGPLMVSIRPIRPSTRVGTTRGWLVFALWLDQTGASEIAHTTQLKSQFIDPESNLITPSTLFAVNMLASTNESHTEILNPQTITGYKFLKDIFGQPSVILRIEEPRDFYSQGAKSVDFIVRLLLVSALVFGLVNFVVIEFTALRRVYILTRQVEEITEAGDDDRTIALPGKDELSQLASRINMLLLKTRESKVQLRQKNIKLKRAVDELATTNIALENAVESIARVDKTGKILTTNAAFDRMFSDGKESLIGKHWQSILSEASRDDSLRSIMEMAIEGRSEVELVGQKGDGKEFYTENVFLPFVSENGGVEGHYWFVKDITDRKVLESQIQHQAFHDALTELPNRTLFLDRLDKSLSRARRKGDAVAMIFVDLDNFKVINDSWGHDAGDAFLIEVSKLLTHCVRPEDTVARLGGDEFTILLSDLKSLDEAKAVALRIKESFKSPVDLKTGIAYPSASLGITYVLNGDSTPEEMLRDADTAMYRAKAQGGSTYVVFDISMNAQAVQRMEIEAGLRSAIENDELHLEFQPLVDLENERVIGIEALLRWNSAKLGVVNPDIFIPVAEETGLIQPIGDWVLETSFRMAKDWNDRFGGSMKLAVNLSGMQLKQPNIVEVVADKLDSIGLDPALLELEITESMLMRDVSGSIDRLNRLRSMGVSLAIDDFGTGYSSLSCLSAFPLNTVKIDRSFIAKITEGTKHEAVVSAIVILAKSLKFEVTAEGIERIDQLKKVEELGCNTAQGYLFFEPLSAESMEEALANGLLERKPLFRKSA